MISCRSKGDQRDHRWKWWSYDETYRSHYGGSRLVRLQCSRHAETVDGVISGINPDMKTVTLEGGETFEVARAGMLNMLSNGDHAIVTYHMKNGKMVAAEIIAKSDSE